MRGDLGFHLHGLEHHHGIPRSNLGSGLHEPLHHRAGHAGAELTGIPRGGGSTAVGRPLRRGNRNPGGHSPAGPRPAIQQVRGKADGEAPAVDVDGNGAPLTIRNGRAELRIRRDRIGEVRLDPPGVDAEGGFGGEVRSLDDRAVERQDGGNARDLHFCEGTAGTAERLLAVGAGDDQLGQQGIELWRHDGAGTDSGVEPDARTGGTAEAGDRPG